MKSTLASALLFICCTSIQAQSSKQTVKVLTKVVDAGVLLRWAPVDASVWQVGNQFGYAIDRYTLDTNGNLVTPEPVRLNTAPIKPLSEEQFNALAKTIPEASAISELIYETEFKNTNEKNENPASLLKRSEDLDNRFGMALLLCDLTPNLAQAAGLSFTDSIAMKGARYIYKVSLADISPKINVEPGVTVVDVVEPKPLQPFNDLIATFGDKTVTLSWSTLTHTGIYTAYIVEKSVDGKVFKTITDLPYLSMTEDENSGEVHFVDSLENNSNTYHYRVVGITPFGEKGPPSNTVSGIGKHNLAGLLILREVKRNDKSKVAITWEFPVGFESKIGGFVLERAATAEGPYTAISKKAMAKNIRSANDATVTASAYYRIRAVDVGGQEISSSYPYFFYVEDNVPPVAPVELKGKIDAKGIVTLSWKNNPDVDLMGYRVFTADDLNHEFIEVTAKILPTPAYQDTVNVRVLNKKVFYKVVAVDNNFNASDYSRPLVLYKPDLIAPAAPVFEKIEKKEQSVVLHWTNSVSNDVSRYSLYRITDNDTAKTNILNWSANKIRNEFEDDDLQAGKTYRYILSAFDSSNNVSTAYSKAITFSTGLHKAVSDITATIERDKKLISLTWKYEKPSKKCLLYKRKNNEPFTLYQILDGAVIQFTDNQVLINNTYSYKIQLVLEKKVRTEISDELKVPF